MFLEKLKENTNEALTTNGAESYASTLDAVLDFFSKSGALRGQDTELVNYFMKAYFQDETLALKALFYMRDIRGGQGERRNFRILVKKLANEYPESIKRNIHLFSEYGRWDDLFSLFGTDLEKDVLELIHIQLDTDIINMNKKENISMLAKWMKSINTSSSESRKIARITATYLEMSPRTYRRILSKLRAYLKIVEVRMSANKWDRLDYSKVPSQASRIYKNAFVKHDEERYNNFIENVASGKETINAGTLYPYDIVRDVAHSDNNKTLDVLWNALPNYADKAENSICVIDVSGSMTMGLASVAPIDVAMSLGIYLAERIDGYFKNHFITFSAKPQIQTLVGNTISEKVKYLREADWGRNTDLLATFDLLLKTAIDNKVPKEELPTRLYIISDMQFDEACEGYDYEAGCYNSTTNFKAIDKMYADAGYKRPELVFWDVNAQADNPVTKNEEGTYLVSGCSPSILKYAIDCEAKTPVEFMKEVLNSERYKDIA